MRLVTGGLVVSGRIELREPWLAELVPDAPLAPLTTYRMELTRDIRDLDGDPLEDAGDGGIHDPCGAAGLTQPDADRFRELARRIRPDLPGER